MEEARRLRELPHKLTFSSRKLGDRWSKWVDRDRKDGWQHIDPALETEWNRIVIGLTELDIQTRTGILEIFVDATGIPAVPKSPDSHADNKVRFFQAYLIRLGLLKWNQNISFSTSGAVVAVFQHLSGLTQNPEIDDLYRQTISGKTKESGRPLSVQELCGTFGEWLDQPAVRDYFSSRSNP